MIRPHRNPEVPLSEPVGLLEDHLVSNADQDDTAEGVLRRRFFEVRAHVREIRPDPRRRVLLVVHLG